MDTQTVVHSPVQSETQETCVVVQEASPSVPEHSPVSARKSYAGLWRRLVAYLIDALIIIQANLIITIVSVMSVAALTGVMNETIETRIEVILRRLMYSVGAWLYFALCESSRSQATPGKLALGIKVVGPDGAGISFGRATGRFSATALSNLTLGVGYVMVAFTPKKQALHDMIANCFVVRR